MDPEDLRSMLSRIPGVRQACDLDLLLFFHRHPCALLTNEQLVAYLGYEREQVAKSLDGLIAARLVTRSQNPSQAACLYALETGGAPGGLLSSFLKLAATRQGRRDAMRLLEPNPTRASSARRRPPLSRIA